MTSGAIGGDGLGRVEGAAATIKEGVPSAEVGRGPALLVCVSCVVRHRRRESGGRDKEGGEGTMEMALGADGTALA